MGSWVEVFKGRTAGIKDERRRLRLVGEIFFALVVSVFITQEAWPFPEFSAARHDWSPVPTVYIGKSSVVEVARQARRLAAQGKYEEAIAKTQEALALATKVFGPDHENIGYLLDDLAAYHLRLNRLEAALSYSARAVTIVGDRLGREASGYGAVANTLATIFTSLGQFKDAERLYREAHKVFVSRLGLAHARTARTARNLGIVYAEMSRNSEARKFFEQAIEANRKIHGDDSVGVAKAYLDAAGLYLQDEDAPRAQWAAEKAKRILSAKRPINHFELALADLMFARIAINQSELLHAETLLRGALDALEAAAPVDWVSQAAVLYELGFIYILRGQYLEAEPQYKRVLALYREVLGENHPAVARTLHSLAIVYKNLGQFDQAEILYQKAINVFKASFGGIDASVAATRLERALLLTDLGMTDQAIREARAALSVYEQLPGEWTVNRGYAMSAMGFALHKKGHLLEAAQLFEIALALIASKRGDQSSDLPPGWVELGEIYLKQGRFADAEAAIERAIVILEKDLAITPAGLAKSLSVLVRLRMEQGRRQEALELARRYMEIMRTRLSAGQHTFSSSGLAEQVKSRDLFELFLKVAYSVAGTAEHSLLGEIFEVAQFPHLSSTTAAISRLSARFVSGDEAIARLVRERQDAIEHFRALDQALTSRLAGLAEGGASGNEARLREDMAELVSRIERLDESLHQRFPDFAELTNPKPRQLEQTQRLLQPGEAILLQVTAEDETFLFLVKQSIARFARTGLGSGELTRRVRALRAGLDLRDVKKLSELPPLDLAAAHSLYRDLLGPFEEDLRDVRHLIFVLDGAMQNLPPSVLLISPEKSAPEKLSDYGNLDFLGRRVAISVLPSVSALRALRLAKSAGSAPDPFIGFGDPVLEGSPSGKRTIYPNSVFRRAIELDLDALRKLAPLPETAKELAAMAQELGAEPDSIYLKREASETTVKRLDLARYRVITFATHGLVAGEFRGLAEPALVLTPPEFASPTDDGLLTASEIASLRLNADWVILSACNTAAPEDRPGAEGLSGLAKAFFYAGARALLVSHWSVESYSTVLLTTGSISALAKDPRIGRAEALRRAMVKLMDGAGASYYAHPAFWAPFVIVGEGGRPR